MAVIILVDDLQEEMRQQTRRVSIMGKILSDFSKGKLSFDLIFPLRAEVDGGRKSFLKYELLDCENRRMRFTVFVNNLFTPPL